MIRVILEALLMLVGGVAFLIFIVSGCSDEKALLNCIKICSPRETKAYNIKDKTCVCDKVWTEVKE